MNSNQTYPQHSQGKLISLEGIEGAGKTTHLEVIRQFLAECKISTVVTREPGATDLGKEIRALLLSPDYRIDAYTELTLLFADRADHIQKIIKPALSAGNWVISDRFFDSSLAYQGAGRGVPSALIQTLINHICEGIQPTLTLLFDAECETALQRIESRQTKDRFEAEDIAFFERIRQHYLTMATSQPERWAIINANETLDDVKTAIKHALTTKLAELIKPPL